MPTSTLLPVHYSPLEDTCSRFSFLFIHSLCANRKEPTMLRPWALTLLFKLLFLFMNIHSYFKSTNNLTIFTLSGFPQMRTETIEWWLWRDITFNEPNCLEIKKNTYHNSHVFINIVHQWLQVDLCLCMCWERMCKHSNKCSKNISRCCKYHLVFTFFSNCWH